MSKAENKNIDSVIQEGDFQEEQGVVIEVIMNDNCTSKLFIVDL